MNRRVLILLVVQLVSLFGTHMGDFALSLHLYEQVGSLFSYSLFLLIIILPEVLLAPILGLYVDRYNKKILMLIGHGGAGLGSAVILILLYMGNENLYLYFGLVAMSSVFNSLVFVTFNTALGFEVDDDKMHVAASFIQLGIALVLIGSPAFATAILENYGIEKVFYVDIATFSVALIVISLTRFNFTIPQGDAQKKALSSIFEGVKEGLIYIKNDIFLLLNLALLALLNFSMAMVSVLITPLVLSMATVSSLGFVMSMGGVGMLVGSFLIMRFKTENYLFWMNRLALLQAIILVLAILDMSVILIGLGAFLFMGLIAMIGALNFTYWQKQIKDDLKGRLFGLRNSIMALSIVLGYLASAPLSEYVMKGLLERFEFLLVLIGIGFHPEIRLLFIINGILLLAFVSVIEARRLKMIMKEA